MAQRYIKGAPDWGTPVGKVNKKVNYYANIGSGQKRFLLM